MRMNRKQLLLLISALLGLANALDPKVDCQLKYETLNKTSCVARKCVWNGEHAKIPCSLPLDKVGYRLPAGSTTKLQLDIGKPTTLSVDLLPTSAQSVVGFSLAPKLTFTLTPITSKILRFQLKDAANPKRYEVPVQGTFELLKNPPKDTSPLTYDCQLANSSKPFGLRVLRKDSGEALWDSSVGGLIFSDQLLQITTTLSSSNLYGMGETVHQQLRHDLDYQTWPLFAFDQPPDELQRNAYGVHPFLLVHSNHSGTSHGIFFLNSNAMEYTLTPDPSITYKTSGGILDFVLFVGDNPEETVQLYHSLIGRTMMPPFFGLGFQISRWGYKNLTEVAEVIDRNLKAEIPMDIHYIDIDYMSAFQDFTYDKKNFAELPAFVERTRKEHDLRWMFIVDVAIQANDNHYKAWLDGKKADVFVRWDPTIVNTSTLSLPKDLTASVDRNIFYGRVWPKGAAAFPDFFKSQTQQWWEKNLKAFYFQVKFDGIWIDMNEPANFDNHYEVCPTKDCYMSECPHNKYDFPETRLKAVWVQNRTDRRLSYRTLCLATRQGAHQEYLHYDVHSLYALSEAMTTKKAVQNILQKRALILSRSSYASSGRYTAHWTGDNNSSWVHLRNSIIGMLEFNWFGVPFVGADICGFQGSATAELCLRWLQLGAFYPFSRSHNDMITNKVAQDPAAWLAAGHPEVTDAARNALRFRYKHLHYYYTLFFRAHTRGGTVVRPLFHEFPRDAATFGLQEQFMVGPAMLVSPWLYEKQTELKFYLPGENGTWWYDIDYDDARQGGGGVHHQSAPEDPTRLPPIYFRSGHVVPSMNPVVLNTKQMRQSGIVLNAFLDPDGKANGELYWDDGESIDPISSRNYNLYRFKMEENATRFQIVAEHVGYAEEKLIMNQLNVFLSPTFHFAKHGKLIPIGHINNHSIGVGFKDGDNMLQFNMIGMAKNLAEMKTNEVFEFDVCGDF